MREIPKFQNDYNIQIRRADEKDIGNLFKSSKIWGSVTSIDFEIFFPTFYKEFKNKFWT